MLGGVPTVFSTESMRNAERSSFSVSGTAATSTERSENPSPGVPICAVGGVGISRLFFVAEGGFEHATFGL